MKKPFVILIILLLFLTLFLSGCEQLIEKPEKVNVNIFIMVFIEAVDEYNNPINQSFTGSLVNITIFKNGGNIAYYERLIQRNNCQLSYDLDIIKGDTIEYLVNFETDSKDFYPLNNGSDMLTWETAHSNMNLNGNYNWYSPVTIIMIQKTTLY